MSHADFAHLRVHTAYSLLEGAMQIKHLIALCQERNMPALAITDSGNMFGALEFSEACRAAGVQPIIGCALGVERPEAAAKGNGRRPPPDRLVLLAQNEDGYANLLALSSRAFLEIPAGEIAHVAWPALEAHAAGLIALTGWTSGAVGRLLGEGQTEAAREAMHRLASIYPGRLYAEVARLDMPGESAVEAGTIELAYALDVPLVATNEAFFAEADMFLAHDALMCIADGAYLGQEERRRLTPEHRFKSAEEMRALFADLPEAVDNTLIIAKRCAVGSPVRQAILPKFAQGGASEADELRAQARAGLEARLAELGLTDDEAQTPYRERLEFELDVIIRMDYPGYFLIVADFIKWAKANGIPVGPGRGSGAGSVAAWALTITDLDPLRFGLLFERFLNPERVSMPDFDIDFCQDRRDEVIRYVQDKYGADQVAQIITFGTLQARAVLRDVGRVLQMPYNQVDMLSKMVPNNPANPVKLAQAIAGEPRFKAAVDDDPVVARLTDIALKLEGLFRHASTHAAGVVIADRPLDQLIPLYRDPRSDMPVTQFSMKYAEMAGLVKFDFLGLKTLTVLERARRLIQERGEALALEAIPLDDQRTYDLLGRGETIGVFQLEGSGMRDALIRLKPDAFEDIIAMVALYRPGPMDNIPRFIACKHGDEEPDYLHESLRGVLEETYGVIIYQEQVMEIAKILSGYSLGQADLLRRAMGKKIRAEMDAQREDFVSGAVERGVETGRAKYIFELVEKFAGYGFNKSHAAAYALVAYQTAWLKANNPVEFLAASMTLDLGNTDKLNVFRQELERMGIALLPPDVNRSGVEFSVDRGAIRYALAAIKNVGRQAMESVVAEREANGPFGDLFDFAGRVDPRAINKRQIESLAKAGAFDGLERNRARIFTAAELLARHGHAAAEEREGGQTNLFGEAAEAMAPPPLPEVEAWPATEQLREEFEAIGFYLSDHPLGAYKTVLPKLGVTPYAEAMARVNGAAKRFKLAGTVLSVQERRSSKGNRFAFVQFSDPSGVFEVMVFSDILAAHREILEPGRSLLVTVDTRVDDGGVRFNAQSLQPLGDVAASLGAGLRVFLQSADPLDQLKGLLEERAAGGRGQIILVLGLDDGRREAEIMLPGRYAVTPAIRAALKALPGIVDVHDA